MKNHPLVTQILVLFVLKTPALSFLVVSPNHCAILSRTISTTTTTTTTDWNKGPGAAAHHLGVGVVLRQSRDWIDEVEYVDDEEEEQSGPPVPPDMKYIPRNVMRQHKNFVAIRQAGGKELTNDVYIREPNTEVFWFIGKVARVSDVTVEQAVSRQWPLIEMHGASLRPIELFPGRGSLEIWTAPGDSEMDVAYNDPNLVFDKMERNVQGAKGIKSALIGFQGEMYEGGEEGFRTWRNEEGRAARPQIQTPNAEEVQNQIDEEDMKKIEEMLQGQDINEIYKEQQRRAGKPVDD